MEDRLTPADPNASKDWPRWFYGPDNQSGVFDREEDVPEGWAEHPDAVGKSEDGGEPETFEAKTNEAGEEVDNFGVTWNADVNTADKGKTKGGLWKLQPGKARPAPAEGYDL